MRTSSVSPPHTEMIPRREKEREPPFCHFSLSLHMCRNFLVRGEKFFFSLPTFFQQISSGQHGKFDKKYVRFSTLKFVQNILKLANINGLLLG